MSQKSILSFFKPKDTNGAEGSSEISPKRRLNKEVQNDGDDKKRFKKNEKTPAKKKSNAKTSKKEEQSAKKPKKEEQSSKASKKEEQSAKTPKKEEQSAKTPKKEEQSAKTPKQESSPASSTEETKEETPKKPEIKAEIKSEQKSLLVKKETQSSPPNTSELTGEDYNPGKQNYDPIKDAFWQGSKCTPYLALARTFQLIEETKGRLKMIEVLGNFFSSIMLLNPEDLLPCVYLSVNQLAPAYEGLELGVAETTIMKVICNTTGRDLKHIKLQTQETGDLGIVAEKSRVAQRMMFKPAPLTVQGVFKKLKEISKISGPKKTDMIRDIFVACRFSEARFFVRSLIGKMRIGIAEQSLLQSLATAVARVLPIEEGDVKKTFKETKKLGETALKKKIDDTAVILKTAYCQCPNYDKLIPTLLEHGIDDLLERCPMEPGLPVKPMLAQPTKGIQEVLDRLDGLRITCEWKYDGERAQIHCDDEGAITIFSRNQENNTTKYPDIISRIDAFKKETGVTSFIVDSEIVAWDVEQKQILPFQVLTTRKRKLVDVNEIKVQVCVYAFDLLYLNGKPLVTKTFAERRQLLKEHFQEVEGFWKFATSCDTSDVDEIQHCLESAIKGNCEGLMIKSLETEASYEIAKRSRSWLKLKKDYLAGVGDSLDLVVIGGYKGKGKRTGSYGGFLLACYDEDNEEYQSICKIGTGFSDDDLRVHAEFFKPHVVKEIKSYFQCDSNLEPDDWFEPVQVWEVKCADLSLSPVHKAAIGIIDPEKGISLRFPRFIRIRDDKSPENATSAQQVATMYNSQDQIKNQTNRAATNEFEDDFY